ncbi:amidohydrolase family protein [Novosphingobium profundi]|uniref:amidohydrolase family protein n=1 Tax=Novosphingobium profundi TaxID=1774954 RepID=UPI001CFD99EF|nr:amidohydrolase family protein [Novosphingobium profundi]
MKQIVHTAFVAVALLVARSPAIANDLADNVAIVGAEVLQVDCACWASAQTIVLTGNRIAAVGPQDQIAVPQNARRIDASGKYVIPGLWDAHIHSRYEGIDHLRLLIAHGVTATRDLGGPWEHLPELVLWRDEIAAGTRVGPRLWTAGTVLNNPGSDWSHITIVHEPQEARTAVQRLSREGADFVKVYSDLSPENYYAIIDEAKRLGLQVDGHDPRTIPPLEASKAGQRTIEHAREVALALVDGEIPELENGYTDWVALEGRLSDEKADRLARIFRENGTWLDPTLHLRRHFIAIGEKSDTVLASPALRFIPAPYLNEWSRRAEGETSVEKLAQWHANLAVESEAVRMLSERGVPIIAGTDTVKPFFVPGFALHDELAALVEAGLSTGDAIRAATITPSRMMGVEDLGLIQPGFLADLLVLDGDPLANIAETRNIVVVVANGRVFDRATLQALKVDLVREAALWNGEPTGR